MRTAVMLVVVALIAVLGWQYRYVFMPAPEPALSSTSAEAGDPVPAASNNTGPRHLLQPEPVRDRDTGELVPLPTLGDSDAWFLLALTDLFGSDTGSVFLKAALIDRLVATIDSLPRSHTPETIRPVTRLAEPFRAAEVGDMLLLGPENFARYDALVARFAAADTNEIVLTYRRFYPLFQESYQRLGYPNAYFNDRVVEVIDHLLETPQIEGPLQLTRPNVLFKFADKELEALSSGQKLLLRMGNEHATTMKHVLRELRAKIIASPTN